MATIYARLMYQYKFKYRIWYSASFHRINEDDQTSNEIELYKKLNNNQTSTESDIGTLMLNLI